MSDQQENEKMKKDVIITGFGGQGIVLAGSILGKAAALGDHLESTLVQSYGPESRGGACSAQVVISTGAIHYPYIKNPDMLVCMSQAAYEKYINDLKPDGLLLVDQDLVRCKGKRDYFAIPATRFAEELGRTMMANIIMIGFLTSISKVVTKNAAQESVMASVPKGTEEANLKAFQKGFDYGLAILKGREKKAAGQNRSHCMKRPKDRLHKVIVIGATPAGIAATNKLGEMDIPVTLIDSHNDLDQTLSQEEWRLDSGVTFNYAHRPGLIRILRNPSIECIMPADVKSVKHNAQGFRVRLTKIPSYVDPDRCTLCGRCVEVCPVTTPDGFKAIRISGRMGLPGRPVIDKRKAPLCQESCPLGVNAQGYIALTRAEKFKEALALVRKDNILPAICGRICTHPCEANCRRGELDEPIAIRDIKRFLADIEPMTSTEAEPSNADIPKPKKRSEKIAVIGSGPAGLSAAADLARKGFPVTVFEKEKEIGGLLRYAIGPHRLPRKILDNEIDYIKNLGVDFVTGHAVDLGKDLKRLTAEYRAVVLATGTWADRKLGIPGEHLEGVSGCLSFLNDLYRNEMTAIHEKVAVIGDGNAAFDLARVLKRLGADVTLLSWFPMDLIPADPEEIKAAREEKIPIVDSLKTVRFNGNGKTLTGLTAKPTIPGPPDENGVPWPVVIEDGVPVEMEFSRAFVAIGQSGALKSEDHSRIPFGINPKGYIETTTSTRTSFKKLYAAGDAVTGPSSVVYAMAAGRQAARDIHADICGYDASANVLRRPPDTDYPEIPEDIPALTRPAMPEKQPSMRVDTFDEVAMGLNAPQIIFETERCLQCGVCSECLQCVEVCSATSAIKHDDHKRDITEHAGVLIIADPAISPQVKGEDVIRSYGPKQAKPDVNAMTIRGFAAAAKALVLLGETSQRLKGHGISFHTPDPGLSPEIRVGVFACRCNDSLGWLDGMTSYMETLHQRPDIVHVEILNSACISEGLYQHF